MFLNKKSWALTNDYNFLSNDKHLILIIDIRVDITSLTYNKQLFRGDSFEAWQYRQVPKKNNSRLNMPQETIIN